MLITKVIIVNNDELEERIDKIFNHVEEDIDIHIECLKATLDFQSESLETRIDTLNDYFCKRKNWRLMKSKRHKSSSSWDEVKIQILNDMPYVSLLGTIKSSFINIELLKVTEPKNIKLNELLNIKKICEISDENILCTLGFHTNHNFMLVVNKNFEIVNKITKIGDLTLVHPCLICKDHVTENLHIQDTEQRVIICDINFKNVKNIIQIEKQYVINELNFYKNKLFIMCSNKKTILEYDSNGNYLKKLILEPLNREIENFQVNNNGIFVLDKHIVYLFNVEDGSYKTCINLNVNNSLQDFCLIDNYIFLLYSNGKISCFEFTNNVLNFEFERKLTNNSAALRLFFIQNSLLCFFNWSKFVNFNPNVFIFKNLK